MADLDIKRRRSRVKTFNAILLTVLLALAVKQLSYALMQGSVFQPLREYVRTKMRQGAWGFETLNELLTCKLCTTMEVSLWCVTLPMVALGAHFDAAADLLGAHSSPLLLWGLLILGSFLYGMAVSGLALGLWNLLEYPAKRYEDVAFKLREAERTITELERVLELPTN